jgi:hyperosmotically inducible protein
MQIRKFLIGTVTALLLAGLPAFAQAPAKPEARQPVERAGNVITDGWLTLKIHAQFIPDKALENSDIDVDTKNGMVVLNGTVATSAGKERAVAIAKATDGVKGVKDNLKVAPAAGGTAMSDGWIKSKIASQFVVEKTIDNSDIDIDVAKGVVTLNGTVSTTAGRARAEALAKATDGVTSVTNNLKVSAAAKY